MNEIDRFRKVRFAKKGAKLDPQLQNIITIIYGDQAPRLMTNKDFVA